MVKKFDLEQPSSIHMFLIVFFITAIAMGIRLFYLNSFILTGTVDSIWYIRGGIEGIFSTVRKGQPFILLLGLSMKLFGSTYMAVKLPSLILGSLLCVSVYFLGSELFGKKVGLIAALITSLNPLLVFYHGLVFREPLFSLTWTTFVFFAIRGFKNNKFSAMAAGVLFALSSMIIEIALFAPMGFIIYFIYERFFKEKSHNYAIRSLNFAFFFLGAVLIFSPFLIINNYVYGDPFIQWINYMDFLDKFYPNVTQIILWTYYSLMLLMVIVTFAAKFFHIDIRFPRNSFIHSSSTNDSGLYPKIKKNFLKIIIVSSILIVALHEILRGPSIISNIALGTFKLLEILVLPESMGFLLFFSVLVMLYTLRRSKICVLILSAFLFSFIGLAWGILSHWRVFFDYSLSEILTFIPRDPIDNSYRYVSSFIPFLTIFAVYALFLIAERLSNTIHRSNINRKNVSPKLRTVIVSFLILIITLQSFYGTSLLVEKAQKDPEKLEQRYVSVIQWLNSQGSPRIYTFNHNLQELYGTEKVVVLAEESLVQIVRRASEERIGFIISDIFGDYSETQIALYLAGHYEDPSRFINLDRFQLVKSYSNWPHVQIFNITMAESNQTALVIEHENSGGKQWVSLLSHDYLVDTVNDEEDLEFYFSWNYKLIVLAELRRTLTVEELEILRQRVSEGTILMVCGLSPAYLRLDDNAYWIGATKFVEAPKDARWKVSFTESAIDVSTEIDLNEQYVFYSDRNWSSPTGLEGMEGDTLILATRVEDGAAAIYAKSYLEGTVIFSGIRLFYASSSEDYELLTDFLETLRQKVISKELFLNPT